MARILVVDDDPEIARTLQRILEHAGHVVTTANNGTRALKCLETSSFDLLITDIVMPDQDGLAIILQSKKKNPALPIIALSGGGLGNSENYLKMASAFGANKTCEKPFEPIKLIQHVDELIRA